VDAYIARAGNFAKPILRHLRELVHATCPEVEETIKWQHPTFMYRGMLGGMAAFKAHCAFGLWKGRLIFGSTEKENEAMGHFGRLTKVGDLPKDEILIGYLKKAMALNEGGVALPKAANPAVRKELVVPEVVLAALRKDKKAAAVFEKFSPSHKKEYVEWIVEAKREETREKRIATMLEWLAEGKSRNWKYANC
jgi:uncharacterized protein YdeI (YjbR/CyaY-like superfamily)